MNWAEFTAARQLLAEKVVGSVLRKIEAQEDDEFERSYRAAGRG
jgi:hypothetical protein